MLNRVTTAEGLPDGSGKPSEGFVYSLVPDVERTAGTKVEGRRRMRAPKKCLIWGCLILGLAIGDCESSYETWVWSFTGAFVSTGKVLICG